MPARFPRAGMTEESPRGHKLLKNLAILGNGQQHFEQLKNGGSPDVLGVNGHHGCPATR